MGPEHPLHSRRGEADRPVRLPHPGRRNRDEAGVNVIKLSSFVSDTQHNDTQCNDIQYNTTRHNATQHNATQYNAPFSIMLLNIMTFSI